MPIGCSRRRSLRIFALMMFGMLLGMAGFAVDFVGKVIGLAVMLLSMMISFGFAARLRCSHCAFLLSRKFPVGSLIFLWLAKEQCPSCGEEL